MKQEKYTEVEGVHIERAKVPRAVRHLLPFAEIWCYLGDQAVYDHLEKTSAADVCNFVQACQTSLAELEEYCFDEGHGVPIPDEVVLFQTMYQNFLAARSRVWLRNKQSGKTGTA